MESTNFAPEPQQAGTNKNRNLIIGVVIAIILCCCCLVTGVGGYYMYQGYVQAQQAMEEFQNFEIPEFPTAIPFDPTDPNSESDSIPGFDFSGDVPEGGLADDETRLTAWFTVQLFAAFSECENPTVEGTTITVLEQPDASGVWKEEWNVNCGDGSFQPQKVIFTPEDGFVNVEVEMPSP